MTRTIVAFGPFDPADQGFAAAAETVAAEIRYATTVAEMGLAQMPRRPDVLLLRLDTENLDDFTSALHTHPKLEGVPVLAILPRLTQTAAIRASSLGADDFLALDDVPTLLPGKLAAATREAAERPRPQQCRVLLGDASAMHGRVLSRLLVQAGFDVKLVASADDARAELGEPRGYGLIILDLGLPGCDPRTFMVEVREKIGDATPPALAMIHAGVPAAQALAASIGGFRHTHDKRRPPDELVFLAHEASITDHAKLRASPRLLCAILVGFRREGGRWEYGLSHNLSLSGLYVRTIDPPPQEAQVDLEFTPPGNEAPVRTRGQVMWRKDFSARAVRASPTGMGLKLLDPDEATQRAMALAAHELARQGPTGP
ncbi:MAG: PilZ domain-containing protein [Deltaproteobacteria bacterium]|nr:PilZ domain-containing protein [Deltaproteobacteria bacterium]